jgi:hypothetical protein
MTVLYPLAMMLSKADSLLWLCRCSDEYQDHKVRSSHAIEDFEDFSKLGQAFVLVNDMEEVDLGNGEVKWLTYISAKLSSSHK